MLEDGKRIQAFVYRTLLNSGAIHEDDSANQTTEANIRILPSMPTMLIDRMLIPGVMNTDDDDDGSQGLDVEDK